MTTVTTDLLPALLEMFLQTEPTDKSAAAFSAWAHNWLQAHPLQSLVVDTHDAVNSVFLVLQYHSLQLRLGPASQFGGRHKSFSPIAGDMTSTAPRGELPTPDGNNCISI